MIRETWQWLHWYYWDDQRDYLEGRLKEIDAEENNLREDRKRVQARLMKASAKTVEYGSVA